MPDSYRGDVLETAAVLGALGHGQDPRLANTRALILSKQDSDGRWMLERTLNGKMWIDIEEKGKPSKWVTLRALRVLKYMNRCVPHFQGHAEEHFAPAELAPNKMGRILMEESR